MWPVAEGKLKIDGDYFLFLSGLESDLMSFSPLTFSENAGEVLEHHLKDGHGHREKKS